MFCERLLHVRVGTAPRARPSRCDARRTGLADGAGDGHPSASGQRREAHGGGADTAGLLGYRGRVACGASGRTVAGMAGAVALVSLVTQFQTAYFLFGSAGVYAVFRTVHQWRSARLRDRRAGAHGALLPFGVFLGGALLGGGIAAFQILPAGAYVGEFSRRTATTVEATPEEQIAYSSSWSFHPEEVMSLVVPEFVGNSYADADWAQYTYWGRNAIKFNHEYLGVSVLVLALFGLLGRREEGTAVVPGRVERGCGFYTHWGTHTPVWRVILRGRSRYESLSSPGDMCLPGELSA